MDTEINIEHIFEPKIVGFICNWEAYSGLEMAGINRIEYSSNVNFIKLMCLGRIHLGLVLKAFEQGADGVILVGCPSHNCRYEFGIGQAERSIEPIMNILNTLGLGAERLSLVNVPLAGGEYLAGELNSFVEKIRNMGPGLSGAAKTLDSASRF